MNEDDYIERSYNIFRDIGNIATSIHAFKFEVDNSLVVQLPCNVEFIEAVSTGDDSVDSFGAEVTTWHADWGTDPNYYLPDVMNNPAVNKVNISNQESRLHPKGEFLAYNLQGTVGNYQLQFDESNIGTKGVCIYRGICVDDKGNPLLTRKEANAIAHKLAYIITQKRWFMDVGNGDQANKMQYIKAEAGRLMAAAKIPEYMNQNEIDRVFSALTSHDRKVYWSSYKSLK